MSPPAPLVAVVLAGERPGEVDPVARAAGVAAKALVPVAGRPMVERVVEALAATPGIGPIRLVARPEAGLLALPGLHELATAGRLGLDPPAASPSASVAAALEAAGGAPILVTTADHPLLTTALVAQFLEGARASGADLALGLAPAAAVLALAPHTRRTWWRFADGRWSGANLFRLAGPAARPALAFWRRVEAERKRPWRIVRLLGPLDLLLYLTRRLTLAAAMERASRRLGCRVAAVPLGAGEAAIDVDKPEDLVLAEAILTRRAAAGAGR